MNAMDVLFQQVVDLAKARGRRGEHNKLPGDVEHRDKRGRRYFAPPKQETTHPGHALLQQAEDAFRATGHHDHADSIARMRQNLGKPKRKRKTTADVAAEVAANPTPVMRFGQLAFHHDGDYDMAERAVHESYAGHTERQLRRVLREHALATGVEMDEASHHSDGRKKSPVERHEALRTLLARRARNRFEKMQAA